MPTELPPTHITATKNKPGSGGITGRPKGSTGYNPSIRDPAYQANALMNDVAIRVGAHVAQMDRQHQFDLGQIDGNIDQKIKLEGGQNIPMNTDTPASTLVGEKNILVKLYYTEDTNSRAKADHAKSLYNGNSLTDRRQEVYAKIQRTALRSRPLREQLLNNWATAHTAALQSLVHAETAARLRAKETQLNAIIEEQTRRIAEAAERARQESEAARAAEERAREAAANAASHGSGTLASAQPTMTMASGAITLGPAATAVLQTAIRNAVAALASAAAGVASGLAVGVAALAYSSKLSNGELPEGYAFSTPLADLMPQQDPTQHLDVIAASRGSIDLPHRLSSTLSENGEQKISLAKTDGLSIPSGVRVFAANHDADKNVYTVTTNDLPPRTLVWTPITTPDNSSTASPTEPQPNPLYIGATLAPADGLLESYPDAGPANFLDLITVFPADSGIDPIYTMFSSPYEGATVKGKHSGRMYNPDNAGGPTQNLSWENATITQAGIDLVKLHTGRFGESADNNVMIDRLNKILTGEISPSDIDKRFYTHEIRELERYRALGVKDDVEGNVWNDAHAATLEDYKLKDDPDLLYTFEATEAYRKQEYGE